jgi:hypothetical protein
MSEPTDRQCRRVVAESGNGKRIKGGWFRAGRVISKESFNTRPYAKVRCHSGACVEFAVFEMSHVAKWEARRKWL